MAYFSSHSLGIQMPQCLKCLVVVKLLDSLNFAVFLLFAPIYHAHCDLKPHTIYHHNVYSIIFMCVFVVVVVRSSSLLFSTSIAMCSFLRLFFISYFASAAPQIFIHKKHLNIQHQVHISSSITVYHKHLIAPPCIYSAECKENTFKH